MATGAPLIEFGQNVARWFESGWFDLIALVSYAINHIPQTLAAIAILAAGGVAALYLWQGALFLKRILKPKKPGKVFNRLTLWLDNKDSKQLAYILLNGTDSGKENRIHFNIKHDQKMRVTRYVPDNKGKPVKKGSITVYIQAWRDPRGLGVNDIELNAAAYNALNKNLNDSLNFEDDIVKAVEGEYYALEPMNGNPISWALYNTILSPDQNVAFNCQVTVFSIVVSIFTGWFMSEIYYERGCIQNRPASVEITKSALPSTKTNDIG